MQLKLELLRSRGLPSLLIEVVVTPSSTVREVAERIARAPEAGLEISLDASMFGRGSTHLTLFKTDLATGRQLMLLPKSTVIASGLRSGDRVLVAQFNAERQTKIRDPVGEFDERNAEIEVVCGSQSGNRFKVIGSGATLGRSAECDLRLADTMVSKRHARIEVGRDSVRFVDLGSANGLVVNNEVLSEVVLRPGELVTVGNTDLLVKSIEDKRNPEKSFGNALFMRAPLYLPRFGGQTFKTPKLPELPEPSAVPWLLFLAPILMGMVLFAFTRSPLSIMFVALSPLLMAGNHLFRKQSERQKLKRQLQSFNDQFAILKNEVEKAQTQERSVRLLETPTISTVLRASLNQDAILWSRQPVRWHFLTLNLGLGKNKSRVSLELPDPGERTLAESLSELSTFVNQTEDISNVPIIESLQIAGSLGVVGAPDKTVLITNALLAQLVTLQSPKDLWIGAIADERGANDFDWLSWLPHVQEAQLGLGAPVLCTKADDIKRLLLTLSQLVDIRKDQLASGAGDSSWSITEAETINRIAAEDGTKSTAGNLHENNLPTLVLLVTGVANELSGKIVALLEKAYLLGIHLIWVAEQVKQLPAICATYVVEDSHSVSVFYTRSAETITEIQPELLSTTDATLMARSLSKIEDAGAFNTKTSDLPGSVTLISLLGKEVADDQQAIITRWNQTQSITPRVISVPRPRSRPGSLRAVVGVALHSKLVLDLRAQGPHALVGGTTGSGKSEFLQTWVLSLATSYSPDRVTFLFLDYKGGSAFADCTGLPHCVGLVTDLTPHLAHRSLISLGAEIRFREQLFNEKKFKDITQFELSGDPECPPVLIIVIDEFAALATDMPQFVDGVVDIAQRGRSLGIHLIMATQRPAGVIKENLRANTNMRIALRMADKSDSIDVVGSDISSHFSGELPGRAAVKIGSGSTEIFQSAYAGGFFETKSDTSEIVIRSLGFGSHTPWTEQNPKAQSDGNQIENQQLTKLRSERQNDIARIVNNCKAAAQTSSIAEPGKPWLDALALTYDLGDLRARDEREFNDLKAEGLPLGVVDDPHHQSQNLYRFSPDDDGNLLIFGTNLSGKSTVLRSIAAAISLESYEALANRSIAEVTEIYALDFATDSLKMLEKLPQVGSVLSGDDHERTARLIKYLQRVIDKRIEMFASATAGNLGQYRNLTGNNSEPRIYLLVDGLVAFRNEYEHSLAYNNFLKLQKIVADGRQLGVHVIATVERPSGLPAAALSGFNKRIVLRQADNFDYALLGAPQSVISAESPAGRAIVDGLETQLAVLGGRADLLQQASALQKLAHNLTSLGQTKTLPVKKLPRLVLLNDLKPLDQNNPVNRSSAKSVAIGIADDTLQQANIETNGIFMISGPPGSGRSTALETICVGLEHQLLLSSFIFIGMKRSSLTSKEFWSFRLRSAEQITSALPEITALASSAATTQSRVVLIIESVSDLLDIGVDREVLSLIKLLRRNGHFVLGESESSTWQQSWPLLQEFKNARRGLALQPDPSEGELLYKTAFKRRPRASFALGSALLVESGASRKVQVATTVLPNQ